jgi:hypothetical protein
MIMKTSAASTTSECDDNGNGRNSALPATSAFPDFAPWPSFSPAEIEAVNRVLQSGNVNYWTGEEGRTFEREFADWTGTRFAIALANGTLALEAALDGVGIAPGDDVVVPCRTYVATASSVAMKGARPVFADVDPVSQNVTAATIRAVLTPRTRAVIVVHLAGCPCDMDSILELAREKGLKVIEDCAQALGATYRGRRVGSFGDIGAFSFCQDKIMTTGGEGGMITTNDESSFSRMWSLKDHGKNCDRVFSSSHPPGFRWLCDSFGSNWRMTEMQAAIGRVNLPHLAGWVKTRREHAAFLLDGFKDLKGLRLIVAPPEVTHAYYKLYAFVRPETMRPGWSRDRLLAEIAARGVPCFVGSCSEVYREAAFVRAGFVPAAPCEVSRGLGETSLMFLCHHTLSRAALEKTVAVVRAVAGEACT